MKCFHGECSCLDFVVGTKGPTRYYEVGEVYSNQLYIGGRYLLLAGRRDGESTVA